MWSSATAAARPRRSGPWVWLWAVVRAERFSREIKDKVAPLRRCSCVTIAVLRCLGVGGSILVSGRVNSYNKICAVRLISQKTRNEWGTGQFRKGSGQRARIRGLIRIENCLSASFERGCDFDGGHTGGGCGLDTHFGVFEDEAVFGGDAEAGGGDAIG